MLCCTHVFRPLPESLKKKGLNIYYFCPISPGAIDPANQSYLRRSRWRECKEMNQNIMGRPLIIIAIHTGRLVIWFEEEGTRKYHFPLSTNLVEKIIRKDP